MKKIISVFLIMMVTMLGLTACKIQDNDLKKLKDLEFTVVENDEVPKELMKVINEKKEVPFKLTYEDGDYLFIVVGYGVQKTGGYSITVDELFLTSNAVYIDTNLLGPSKDEVVTQALTYPFVVVKLEKIDKSVVFN